MKKIMAALLLAALVAGSVFAQLAVRIDVDSDLLNITKNKENGYFTDSNGKALPYNSGDTDVAFTYNDPDGKYGGSVFVMTDILTGPAPKIGDAFAWIKFGSILRVKVGSFGERAQSKVYGDKDSGVLTVNAEGAFGTTDPFKLGGILTTIYAGPAEIWLAANPDLGYKVASEKTGSTQPSLDADGNWKDNEVVRDYNYGVAAKYVLTDVVDLAAALRLSHSGSAGISEKAGGWGWVRTSKGSDQDDPSDDTYNFQYTNPSYDYGKWGTTSTDFGLYANIKALSGIGLGLGIGAYGQDSHTDSDDSDVYKYEPGLKLGFDLQAKYTGIDKLTVQLSNNASFWTDPIDAASIPDGYADTKYFVLYNDLDIQYALTSTLTADLLVRNYLGSVEGVQNMKDFTVSVDTLTLQGKVTYAINGNASAFAGLKYTTTAFTADKVPSGQDKSTVQKQLDTQATNTFSVPVGITIKF